MNSQLYNLNTYKEIPSNEYIESHISDLIDLCIERIRLYKLMEDAKNLHDMNPGTKQWNTFMKLEVKSRKLKTYDVLLQHNENVGVTTARRNDHLAHWLLSLCYCRTDEQRCNFIKWELQWFILLYKQMTKNEIREFFINNNFTYELVKSTEKKLMEDELKQYKGYKKSLLWYKAPFHTISTRLISCRKVILLKGIAYFPENYVICCVREALVKQFSEQLVWNNRMLTIHENHDERLKYLLEAITPIFKSLKYNLEPLEVNLDNIYEIANDHYPLCMQSLHNMLIKQHHLKYESKMQYGLFLKWLGLSYEDAMIFWEREFTKKITKDRFEREYSYLFKHQYGKVGGKFDYPPYSCEKIQNSTPMLNQCHGCPFKHWDEKHLLKRLWENCLNGDDVKIIVDFVSERKYKEACTVYFGVKHNVIMDDIIQSPNQYVAESRRVEQKLNTLMECICDGSLDCE